jgi:hypothetical protein
LALPANFRLKPLDSLSLLSREPNSQRKLSLGFAFDMTTNVNTMFIDIRNNVLLT